MHVGLGFRLAPLRLSIRKVSPDTVQGPYKPPRGPALVPPLPPVATAPAPAPGIPIYPQGIPRARSHAGLVILPSQYPSRALAPPPWASPGSALPLQVRGHACRRCHALHAHVGAQCGTGLCVDGGILHALGGFRAALSLPDVPRCRTSLGWQRQDPQMNRSLSLGLRYGRQRTACLSLASHTGSG